VDFELSDDQVSLQAEVRRFLGDRMGHESRTSAASLPGAVDRRLWSELAELGVFGIHTPEDEGGVGLGMAEAVVVFEELGRVAVPGPVVATCLAAALGVPGAVGGRTVVGMVEAGGAAALVEHLDALDALLVVHEDRIERVDPPAGDSLPRPLDPLTPVSQVPALPEGDPVADGATTALTVRDGRLLTAAFQVGLGQAALELGTGYAGQRQQFGRTIGSFQAVKHMLADAAVDVDVARAAVHAAAVNIDEAGRGSETAGRSMSVDGARLVASNAARQATESCIQVHGGIGFTWELDAHLFLKRSLALDTALGSTHASVEAVAAAL
jgi:alkylation response protein AidB-like acyl-CoA dehydrogenase